MATDATETKHDINLEVTESKGPGKKNASLSCKGVWVCACLKDTVHVRMCSALSSKELYVCGGFDVPCPFFLIYLTASNCL